MSRVYLAPEVFDKPNGHGLMELLFRALPALRNLNFISTGEYERQHISSKIIRKGCHETQKLALSEDAVIDGLRMAAHGYVWGDGVRIGPALRAFLSDYNEVQCLRTLASWLPWFVSSLHYLHYYTYTPTRPIVPFAPSLFM
jgi:hypothetical protein